MRRAGHPIAPKTRYSDAVGMPEEHEVVAGMAGVLEDRGGSCLSSTAKGDGGSPVLR